MAKRKRLDANELAARIVGIATGEIEKPREPDANAVQRGKARAAKLTPAERSKIARKAARARWGKA